MKELTIRIEKTEASAKVSLLYGKKILSTEDLSSNNILVSNNLISHIRGTIANLIMEEKEQS